MVLSKGIGAAGEELNAARDALIQALGRQSAFWGLGKTAGEMYAALYLSPGPVPLEEVARLLRVTKGNVSIAIRQLERLGMVRRTWQKGDRRVYFEAETDFWQIAHNVLAQRQKPEFDFSFKLVDESRRFAEVAPSSPEREFALRRLAALQEFYGVLDGLVRAALSLTPAQLKGVAETALTLLNGGLTGNGTKGADRP